MDRLLHGDKGLSSVFGNIQEHAAGDDALFPMLDRPPLRSIEGDHLVRIAAVPHAVAIPYMAQRIQMRGSLAVIRDAVVVGGAATAFPTDVPFHKVLRRRGIIGGWIFGELATEGNRA